MKKILSAVDFSSGSVHSLRYSIYLAQVFGADIEMVWVDNSMESSGLAAISRDLRQEVKKQFDELVAQFQPELGRFKLTYRLKKGKVYQEIGNLARAEEVDLIVAGSHGVSGFEQYWIGSNAYRIVSYAPVPVITVRSEFEMERGIHRIVMPIDSTPETGMKIPYAAAFARAFDAEIRVLGLYSTSLRSLQRKVESNMKAACKELTRQGLSSSCESRSSDNITMATIDYAETVGADLIVIMTEKDTANASIMMGHFAQQMVNNAPVPVLSVNPGIRGLNHRS
ncbi:MAG TPA: universal stress protein [Bacteroidales bacterium]|nr:universal stress protein [Bacteroidales bacterium]